MGKDKRQKKKGLGGLFACFRPSAIEEYDLGASVQYIDYQEDCSESDHGSSESSLSRENTGVSSGVSSGASTVRRSRRDISVRREMSIRPSRPRFHEQISIPFFNEPESVLQDLQASFLHDTYAQFMAIEETRARYSRRSRR